tara:strand:- start:2714 stop:3358 length:645 start_codon:yes stop_codon:yes gene_type:complete
MSRTFTSAQNTALESSHVNLLMFAKLEFDSGTVYVHNGIGTYTWTESGSSRDWLGVGDLGAISQVQEGLDVSPYAITLTLSGLPDASFASKALTENYYKRPAAVWVGLLDSTDSLIGTPVQVWSGFMDQMNMSVGADGGDVIQLIAESELARFDKSSDLMYTNASQQDRHSGDKFFNFIHKIQGQKLDWGKSGLGSNQAPDLDETTPKSPGVLF